MSLRRQLSKIAALFGLFRHSADVDEEIRFHLRMEEQERFDSGMPREEAHFAALRRFGNMTIAREESRVAWRWHLSEQLFQDLRFAFRQMRRDPAFTSIAVLTLALGMGATTAFFSLMNALLLKPLPLPVPERLVQLMHGSQGDHGPSLPYPLFENLQRRNEIGVDLVGFSYAKVESVSGPIQKNKEFVQLVSGNFYNALTVKPELGRLFSRSDDTRGNGLSTVAVISDRLWRSSFHSDVAAVGRKIFLDGMPFVVVGVLPPGFFGVTPGERTDIAITFAGYADLNPRQVMLSCRECNSLEALGRLKPGASIRSAEAALRVVWRSALRETLPENLPARYRSDYFADLPFLDRAGHGLDSYLRSRFTKPLYLLLGMSGLILLIGCSNVANLLFARAQARSRELAIRLSAGASQGRIIRQLLTESWLLALLGLAASAAVYQSCVSGLLLFMDRNGREVFLDTSPDARMSGFAVGLMVITGLLFGLGSALRASRAGLRGTLAESAATISRKSRLTPAILAVQIALSIILVTGALLLARSLYGLRTFDAGFRRDHLLIVSMDVSKAIPRARDQRRFEQTILSRLAAIPGVRSVTESTLLPVSRGMWFADFTPDGYTPRGKQDTSCYLNFVRPRYFETMGTALLTGRDFDEHDERAGAPPVAIVSESLARQFWGETNPVGKHVHGLEKTDRFTVVGMVRDAKYRSLRETTSRTIYLRFPPPVNAAVAWNYPVEIWTKSPPEAQIPSVRRVVHDENSQVPLELQAFDELLDRQLLSERLIAMVATWFGVLGLLMAAIGIYGVAAYSVSRRLPEVAIRLALGATSPRIAWLFVREHLLLAFVGISVGVAGAIALTQLLRTWLFGVSSLDGPSFGVSVGLLAGVSVIATLFPAIRALKIEPSHLLRSD